MGATKVNAGLAESKGKILLGIWRDSLHVTCGLTACTPGSAPGPTLGNECGKTLPFTFLQQLTFLIHSVVSGRVRLGWVEVLGICCGLGWVGFNDTVMGWVRQLPEMRTTHKTLHFIPRTIN